MSDSTSSRSSSLHRWKKPSPPLDVRDLITVHKKADAADQAVTAGIELSVKELYRADPRAAWSDWIPDDIDIDPEESLDAKKSALIVRREKIQGKHSLVLHSITIRSPLIRKLLGEVFDGYKGITTKLKDLTFHAPFHEFFYRWDRFQQQITDENDSLVLEHTNLLQTVISPEIQPHLEKRQELLENGLVTFDYLWTLFEPGTVIYTRLDGQDRLYKLVESKYQKRRDGVFFTLACRYIDCDGLSFGYITTSLELNDFEGIKSISELSILPIHLHSRTEQVTEKLWERGKLFEQLNGFHYRSYSGLCILKGGYFGNSNKRNIDDGRMMVDTGMWSTYNPDRAPQLEDIDAPSSDDQPRGDPFPPIPFDNDDEYKEPFYTSRVYAMKAASHNMPVYMNRMQPMPWPQVPPPAPRHVRVKSCTTLRDDQVTLCTPLVRGYCLTSKQWVQLYVDNIREIQWNAEAFQRLILPHDYKEIVWAFVDSQLSHRHSFDDVVQGKGQGIVILLSGEPGVGKTLTAESVAEEMKKPLYSMTAGELGQTANDVEKNLQRVLEISTKWGAVLLLDECDVFLEKRTISDIERNKLVSVFLRLLEYYKGVMFLTTNRVSAFDPAFQSRIHLTINYPRLDFQARMHIWRTFVRPRSDSTQYASAIEGRDLNVLAKLDMNGREIKNTVKTARLLASRKGVPLAMEHMITVLRVKEGSSGVAKTPRGMACEPNGEHSETRTLPPPAATEIERAIRSTGLCGSDLHYYNHYRNGDLLVRELLILGHESAGIVVAVGSYATGSEAAKSFPHHQGTLQERIKHPAAWCHKLPEEVSLDLGAILEPLSVAIHAARRAQIAPNGTTLVFGAGAVGLLCATMAKASGSTHVIIADIDKGRVNFASQNKFAHAGFVVPMKRGQTIEEKLEIAKDTAALAARVQGGKGLPVGEVDLVFECTGVESCLQAAIYATRPGGRVMLIGMGTPIQALPISAAALREVDLMGVFRYANTYPEGIDIISGKSADTPDFGKIVTHRYKGLENARKAFDMARRAIDDGGRLVLKVVIEMGDI